MSLQNEHWYINTAVSGGVALSRNQTPPPDTVWTSGCLRAGGFMFKRPEYNIEFFLDPSAGTYVRPCEVYYCGLFEEIFGYHAKPFQTVVLLPEFTSYKYFGRFNESVAQAHRK